jgi:hypothetical protein
LNGFMGHILEHPCSVIDFCTNPSHTSFSTTIATKKEAIPQKGEVHMATLLFALPIKPGQTEAARAFAQECIGPRYADYDASEQHIGIQVENWYLQRNAAGQFFTIQVEGPDLISSLGAFISSREPFDLWFKEQLASLTGIDLNAGPPPNEMVAETLAEYKAKGA